MRPTLPSAWGRKVCGFGRYFGVLLAWLALLFGAVGCRHVVSDPPSKPGPLVPAEPDISLDSMDAECAGLIAALDTFRQCSNLEHLDREWTRLTIEVAEQSFAAGKKANPDEPAQRAIALACHRATSSIKFATERCAAGPKPKVD